MKPTLRAIYTVNELSDLSGINKWTLWHWLAVGRLPATRIGKSVFVSINDMRASMPDVWANICTKNTLVAGECEACGGPIRP